jgi:DNA-binding transcriptional LysR family regulator
VYRDTLDLLARIEATQRDAHRAARGETGRIVVGAGNYGIDNVVPSILRAFHSRFPNVEIELYEHHTSEQLGALRSGEIDVAFAIPPTNVDGISAELMHEEGFVLMLPANASIHTAGPVDIRDYKSSRFLATPRHLSPGLDDLKARIFRDAGYVPIIAQYATQISTMLALVSAGVGILLTPAVLQSLSRPDILHLPVITDQRVSLCMMTLGDRRQSAALTNFCDTAREIRSMHGWMQHDQRAGIS